MDPYKVRTHSVWRLKGADKDQPKYLVLGCDENLVYYVEVGKLESPTQRFITDFLDHFRKVQVTYGN